MLSTTARPDDLIGRDDERAAVVRGADAARAGRGELLLLTGEAGVGKTRLVEQALRESGLLVLVGEATAPATPPYGPLVAALRAIRPVFPTLLRDCARGAPHLAVLLPELGRPPGPGDRTLLLEAIRSALAAVVRRCPAALFLDNLHWADEATLELLPALARAFEGEPLAILAGYRSDEVPRGHPLRRMRETLRRAGRLRELTLEPLGPAGTTALAARALADQPSPALAAALHDRTGGLPFFVEELAAALIAAGRLRRGPAGLELDPEEAMPLPDSVRDAVLTRADGLPDEAREALQAAAVLGDQFDLALVAELTGGEAGLEAALASGLARADGAGRGSFRHALVREALRNDLPWTRRRALHRRAAERLEAEGADPRLTAEHWLAARENDRARQALLAAAEASCRVHAYRDASAAARRALALWPEDEAPLGRTGALDRLGHCLELCGELTDAARVWREAAEGYRAAGDATRTAEVERRLATVYELQGAWDRALASRQAAAAAWQAADAPAEAAAEHLAAAAHLRSAGSFGAALELIAGATELAEATGRPDLRARALGLEGNVRARMGQGEEGVRLIRRGLSLALDHNLSGPAAEVYQRLGDALEHGGDYAGARDTYLTAADFCRTRGAEAAAQLCLACLTYVLRQSGQWDQAATTCRTVLAAGDATPHARAVAGGMLGSLLVLRGQPTRARPLLRASAALSRQLELAAMEMQSSWALAMAAEQIGAEADAAEHARAVMTRWRRTEDRHYAVPALRWVVTFFAVRGAGDEARACADALGGIAAAAGDVEAAAALAHALGECALLDGDADLAVRHFTTALDLLRRADLPLERAETQSRAGAAMAAAGLRADAIDQLTAAYRTARRLRARPLAAQVGGQLGALGEPIERRLGRLAAGQLEHGGLSRRELEVLRLVALGRTNREVGQELFLAVRTVDMHVRSLLAKLDCRSRIEALRRAGELGLLEPAGAPSRRG